MPPERGEALLKHRSNNLSKRTGRLSRPVRHQGVNRREVEIDGEGA